VALHNEAPMHIFKACQVFEEIHQSDFESFL